ncbi:uncharacterized protein BO66DRAFT_435214 [Aspergillus aculeatinus CBS 121060]|uniref:Uncharacterized protein n=1 Tax=Aspergillus aculeatinus CBS 121060 TaxID=1448322 RepID=A0ACD1HJH0_9EURO|nr:hypothetical protein BO66DRAFT_435214 [Aspergillus aculeatinus CBS 121060]RAH73736.1 hypothetical protein BO66DRAFT_435214 [Aspergillus aculeatinus CBS 121060]
MDLHSDRLFAHTGASFAPSFSSSSFPRRRWSQLSPLHIHPHTHTHTSSSAVVETVRPSPSTHHPYRNDDLSLTAESSRAHRATALRQLNGYARPLSAKGRPATSRPSSSTNTTTLGSQPVLVRAYSGESPNATSTAATMPSRRSFLLFSSRSSSRPHAPALPSEEDFGIDGILRAIEPDIRHTLDAIGEICGRSKLSLANEYGSHIAPLGEIRAPPGGLLTVDEASSDHERQADNDVVIYDDDNSVADGRDFHSAPPFRYWGQLRQATTTTTTGSHSRMSLPADSASLQVQPTTPRSSAALQSAHSETGVDLLLTTREIASKSSARGRGLLGKKVKSDARRRAYEMFTPALVSETLLEAQAESHYPPEASRRSRPLSTSNVGTAQAGEDHLSGAPRPSSMVDMRSLFGWLRCIMNDAEYGRSPVTAEMRLRAMLERPAHGHDD